MANIIAVEIAVMMAIIRRLENLFICGIDISLRGFGDGCLGRWNDLAKDVPGHSGFRR